MQSTERPAMDVTNAEAQEAIANSLLGDEAEMQVEEQTVSELAIHGDNWLNDAIADQDDDVFKHGDKEMERLRSERPEQEQDRPEAAWQEQREPQEQQQAAEPTLEQFREAVQQTDAAIEKFGLTENAPGLAGELAPFFGNAIYQNAPILGTMTAQLTIGARDALLRGYEAGAIDPTGDLDFGKLPAIPQVAARECSQLMAEMTGINWQMQPVHDEMMTAYVLRNGVANMLHTANRLNSNDPREINHKDMCVEFVEGLQRGLLGVDKPVNEERAVKFVNVLTKYVLDDQLTKIKEGLAAASSEQKQPRQRGQRMPREFREGIRGRKIQKFETNQDIFSGAVMQDLAMKIL